MNVIEELQSWQNDSEFKALTYQQQLEARGLLLKDRLSDDPDYAALSPGAKKKVYEELLFQPPAMELEGESANWLSNELSKGNKWIYPAALLVNTQQSFMESPFPKLLNQVSTHLANGLNWLAANYLPPDPFTGQQTDPDYTNKRNRDLAKATLYSDYRLNQDALAGAANNILKVTGSIAGTLTDLAPMYMLGVGELGAPRGFAALGMKGVNHLIEKAPGTLLPKLLRLGGMTEPLVHSVAGGLLGVMRENAYDIFENGMKVPEFNLLAQNSAKYFGDYFLWDLVGFGVLGFAKNVKNFFGKGRKMKVAEAKVKEVIFDALSGSSLDPALYGSLDDDAKLVIRNMQTYGALNRHGIEKATPDEILTALANKTNHALEITDKGYQFLDIVTKKKSPVIKELRGAAQWLIDSLDEPLKIGKKEVGELAQAYGNLKITEKLKLKLKGKNATTYKMLADMAAPRGGIYSTDQLNNFVKGYMRVGGVEDDIIRSVKVSEADDVLKVMVKGEEIANVPKHALDGKTEMEIVDDLIEKVGEYLPEGSVGDAERFLSTYRRYVPSKPYYTPSWVENVVESNGGAIQKLPNGKLQVAFPNAEPMVIDNVEQLGDFIVREVTQDFKQYQRYLAYYEGIKLERGKDQLMLRKGRETIPTGTKDLNEFLVKYPEFAPKIPSELGPGVVLLDKGATKLVYKGRTLTASTVSEAMTELSKFKDMNKSLSGIKVGKKISADVYRRYYEVSLPENGFTQTYESYNEMKEFLEKGMLDFEHMNFEAANKGFKLDVQNGMYYLIGENKKPILCRSLDEVRSSLDQVKMPTWAPELTGVHTQWEREMKQVPGFNYKPKDFSIPLGEEKVQDYRWMMGNLFRTPDQAFITALKKKIAGSPEIMKWFRKVDGVQDLMAPLRNQLYSSLDDALRVDGGKLTRKEALVLSDLLEMPKEKWRGHIEGVNKGLKIGKIREGLLTTAENVRTYFGTTADEGLFKLFDIKSERFLTDYFPRLRKYASTADLRKYTDGDLHQFLHDAYQGRVPKELDFWAEHMRFSDVAQFVTERDARVVLRKYVESGVRKKFLGPIAKDYTQWLGKNGKNVDQALLQRFNIYFSDVLGMPPSTDIQMIRDMSSQFFEKIQLFGKPLAKDITSFMLGTGYLSTMGFRGWLAIRNMFQVWTTLAPRIGNHWVRQATTKVANDATGAIRRRMVEAGVITKDLAVGGGSALGTEDWLSGLAHKGLSFYQGSDDFTRCVAYTASENLFDDMLKRLDDGRVNQKQFMNETLHLLPEDLADAAALKLSQGDRIGAKHIFSNEMVKETMFNYKPGTRPNWGRGVLGRLFGQMGVYPTWYATNLMRVGGSRILPMGKKLAFAGRFLGNSLALYGAFTQFAKIKADNFLPWQPLTFTGGPWFNIAIDMLKSMGPGYVGREARAKVFGLKETSEDGEWGMKWDPGSSDLLRMITPGSLAFRSFMKAGEYYNQGDQWRFFLSLTSAPVVPDED